MFNCEFSTPVNLGTEQVPDWAYSGLLCDESATYELIENATTGASFYLEKTFSYGDFFVMFFLTIFILGVIVKIIWDKFIEKK